MSMLSGYTSRRAASFAAHSPVWCSPSPLAPVGRTVPSGRSRPARIIAGEDVAGALDDIDRARAQSLHLHLEPLSLHQVAG